MRTLTFLAPVLALCSALVGCGGSTTDGTDTTGPSSAGGGGASAGAAGAGGSAGTTGGAGGSSGTTGGAGGSSAGSAGAPAGSGGAAPVGPTVTYAFDTLDVGDVPQSWKTLGANIDGLSFATATSPGHCKPAPGAKPGDVVIDGVAGVDNSFAHNIIPILNGLSSTFGDDVNAGLASGQVTYAIRLGEKQAELFAVRGTTSPSGQPVAPTDWSSYVWHPLSAQVSDPSSPQPTSLFLHLGSADGGTWSSTERADAAALELPFFGSVISVPLRRARIVITPGAGGTAKGTISAIVPTVELQQAIGAAAGVLSPGLCKGSALNGVLDQVGQASDILLDGTQDPSQVCNGISIGLGFTARSSSLGSAVAPVVQDPCGG